MNCYKSKIKIMKKSWKSKLSANKIIFKAMKQT